MNFEIFVKMLDALWDTLFETFLELENLEFFLRKSCFFFLKIDKKKSVALAGRV
jgi:hypothetical protein